MDIQVGDVVTLKKQASLRQPGMGSPADRSGFSAQMCRLRSPDYDRTQTG